MAFLHAKTDESAERVIALLKDTIMLICKTSVEYNMQLAVDGVVGVTVDKKNMFLVNIHELLANESAVVETTPVKGKKRASESTPSNKEETMILSSDEECAENHSDLPKRRKKRKRSITTTESEANELPDCITLPDDPDTFDPKITSVSSLIPPTIRTATTANAPRQGKTTAVSETSVTVDDGIEILPMPDTANATKTLSPGPLIQINLSGQQENNTLPLTSQNTTPRKPGAETSMVGEIFHIQIKKDFVRNKPKSLSTQGSVNVFRSCHRALITNVRIDFHSQGSLFKLNSR